MSRSDSLHALSDRYAVPVYRSRRLVLERGSGARVWDCDGRDYIDFAAGIAVNALGHAHPALVAALTDQAGRLWHTSNVFTSEPPLRLAAELVEASRFARQVFLCNSGAEANEAALKLARRWAAGRGRAPERRGVLSFHGSFHGRTLATVTATAQPKYHAGFEPLPPGFRYAAFNDVDAAAAVMADGSVAAVIVEPVQGEGGVTPATEDFLRHLRALCDRHDALLIFDEIQCGMGRTGHLFACHGYGIEPDVVTLAKALGGGFPVGAMLVGARAEGTLTAGSHGTTFGGNPLAAAVARAALAEIMAPALQANVVRQALALRDGLAALDARLGLFREIRGRGLMLGAELRPEWAGRASELLEHCAEAGVLVLQAGPDVLRLVPPLNLTDAECAEGLRRLGEGAAAFAAASVPA